jgi:4-aminobutyrate aminotransferase/diaminobutyrate-pyruvate transaminase/4-aminobutyrate aminotransferase/(S)-3-amino-2-methylpropionate transaminase|tara:strand:+ start:1061 stop:2446 length:1386 start_codon:yes stop_codon:yes gene_type:complete
MDTEIDSTDTSTGRQDTYHFSITPTNVPKIDTKYRKIVTPIPPENSIPILNELRKYEPKSMSLELPVVWDRAEDFQVFDENGNCWIDFSAGTFVVNAGHRHPKICKAISETINNNFLHNYYFPSKIRAKLVKKLHDITAKNLNKIFLLTTGAEAIECCIKLARIHGRKTNPKKIGIVSFLGAMHGKTLGALMVGGKTKEKHWIGNHDPDMHHLTFPNDISSETFSESMKNLEKKGIDLSTITAFMVESYQGWGALFYPKDYIKELRKWADQNNAIVIFDEIQSGFGRTGKLFAYEHYDVEADLVCCGKGISSGLPLSAVIGRKELVDVDPSLNSTHGGNPVCCASTLASIEVLESENLIYESARKGKILEKELVRIKNRFPTNLEIFGKGLISAIHVKNSTTGKLEVELVDKIIEKAMQKGLLLIRTGTGTIKIGPPLTIPDDALLDGISVIEESIEECLS